MSTQNPIALSIGATAAAAVALGVPLTSVTVVPCNQSLGFVRTGPTGNLNAQVQVALAGWVAQELFAEGPADISQHHSVMQASGIAARMHAEGDPREPLRILNDAREAVRRLLVEQETNVRHIAAVLTQEGTLTGHHIQQIVGGC